MNALGVQPKVLHILQHSHITSCSSTKPVVEEINELKLKFG